MFSQKKPTKIVVTGALHDEAMAELNRNPFYEVVYSPDCSRQELFKLISDAHVLLSRSETDIDREVIECAPMLKLIARAAVGVGNIDLAYATEKGILVINAPGQNTNSAAELTLALLLAMVRKIPAAQNEMKQGGWDRHRFSGHELRHKRIGIVGLGHVGHRVARFAHGLEMQVFGYDPYIASKLFARYEVRPSKSLLELAQQVDILTVHVPLNQETRGMVDLKILESMPRGSYVVNAARGGIIDEKALLVTLESGHIAGAAVDTWEREPKPWSDLVNHPHVWASPHIGASTEEAQLAIGRTIVAQINKALSGEVVDYPVNLPEIGIIDNPIIKPYALLAEKLGRLAGQLSTKNPIRVEASYRGDLVGVDQALIRLGWMKGFASCAVDGFVSYVNASQHFSKLGLTLEESEDPEQQNYRSAIAFTISYSDGSHLSVGGIVFDQSYMRISMINGFYFELEPSGNFLLVVNEDKPGVIGDIGTLLAHENINIDSFALSRKEKGGEAMAVIKVDSELSLALLDLVGRLKNIIAAYRISL